MLEVWAKTWLKMPKIRVRFRAFKVWVGYLIQGSLLGSNLGCSGLDLTLGLER